MDTVTGIGWVLALLGLWGTLHYGRQSAAINKAFGKYVELEDELLRLRDEEQVRTVAIGRVQDLKSEIRELRESSNLTNEAQRLARAADELMRAKRIAIAASPPENQWTYWARGDHTNTLPHLQRKVAGKRGTSIDNLRYLESANLSLVTVTGQLAREVLDSEDGWRFFPPPQKMHDQVSGPLRKWAAQYSKLGPSVIGFKPSPTGEAIAIDLWEAPNIVYRLAFLAVIGDYRPMTIAHYFRGEVQQVDAEHASWVQKHRTPLV